MVKQTKKVGSPKRVYKKEKVGIATYWAINES